MATSLFSSLFGRSPVQPLKAHMGTAAQAARELLGFIDAALDADWERAAAVRKRIQELEHEADKQKADLRIRLPSTLLMPVDRGDVLDLVTTQDKIANRAKDIAGLMFHRKLLPPAALADQYRLLARRSVDAVIQAEKSVGELEDLFTVGFRGSEVTLVERMITELDAIEDETDQIASELRTGVFAMEETLPPVSVIFLYKAIEWLGDLGDQSHRVGGLLQRVIAR
ncbi:TIGR00153 family protein [Pseudofulvimonas gallinarii]|jgi:predicted phosphate transport protein (TIGR00153 family)|uniref:TIGR00153 family protein n=1 Tax=Pseudofulvimonas gallinarii TaxID=634155 RepID=A0A4R3LK94_9GAMM|nr:TIGR00153 family protein [Pseudofulvimonas gallinarii]TCT00663.1 hypothetical protein EDC25_10227 [Pseudofulvimonas gallinarii]THD12024.1 TIGR00153 family protein [Pseudofulvimonas gallinarii]